MTRRTPTLSLLRKEKHLREGEFESNTLTLPSLSDRLEILQRGDATLFYYTWCLVDNNGYDRYLYYFYQCDLIVYDGLLCTSLTNHL